MQPDMFAYLIERMDRQDELLREVSDKLQAHLVQEADITPVLEQVVTMWRGTRLATGVIIGVAATIAALLTLYNWIIPYVQAGAIRC